MEKGKGVMGSGRRWAVDFTDNSTTPSTRDIADPQGFSRASQDQVQILNPNKYLLLSLYKYIYSII